MAKKLILSTSELEKKRRSLKRKGGPAGFVVWLVFFLLGALYLFLAIYGKGSYMLPDFILKDNATLHPLTWEPLSWLTWTNKLPYFNEVATNSIIDFSNTMPTIIYRWLVVAALIIVPIVLAIITSCTIKARNKNKYPSIYIQALSNVTQKEYNLTYTESKDVPENFRLPIIRSLNVEKVAKESNKSAYSAEPAMVYGEQTLYKLQESNRDGYVMTLSLPSEITKGLIQFRSFGSLNLTEYNGEPIKKLGFEEGNELHDFICYTSLGNDIYKLINRSIISAIADLYQYVTSSLCVTIEKDQLMVFLDSFKLRLPSPLKKKLEEEILERQAAALDTLYEKVLAIRNTLLNSVSNYVFIKSEEPTTEAPAAEPIIQ